MPANREPSPPHDEQPIPYRLAGQQPPEEFTSGPSGWGPQLLNGTLARVLRSWAYATGIHEHRQCEVPECTVWLCLCADRTPHVGTEDTWCPHGRMLCETHRLDHCGDCRHDQEDNR